MLVIGIQLVSNMKKILLALAALFISASSLYAQPGPQSLCYTTNGTNCVPAVQASNSVSIASNTASTFELVAASTGKAIYVTSFNVDVNGTETVQFKYGTGTNCGSGTTVLTGVYSLTVGTNVVTVGNGLGVVLYVPQGNALCYTTTAGTTVVAGSVSYAQF